jgi:nitroimidazol reductase NimA-like FMN-containing flavoprotein (pyridoxamine 5'-phosphate oxidase superfamily)
MASVDAAQDAYEPTPRVIPRRHRERARYDRATVHAVLDEGLVAHVGFLAEGAPVVLPTVYARLGETLYLHGSSGGRFASLGGTPICVTVTLLDGLVLAPSWLNHSAAYRSVVAHGTARLVTDARERDTAMAALLEHVLAGRSRQTSRPNRKDDAATAVLALELLDVSCKTRDGALAARPEELTGPAWSGFVPLRQVAGVPVPAPGQPAHLGTPPEIAAYPGPVPVPPISRA